MCRTYSALAVSSRHQGARRWRGFSADATKITLFQKNLSPEKIDLMNLIPDAAVFPSRENKFVDCFGIVFDEFERFTTADLERSKNISL